MIYFRSCLHVSKVHFCAVTAHSVILNSIFICTSLCLRAGLIPKGSSANVAYFLVTLLHMPSTLISPSWFLYSIWSHEMGCIITLYFMWSVEAIFAAMIVSCSVKLLACLLQAERETTMPIRQCCHIVCTISLASKCSLYIEWLQEHVWSIDSEISTLWNYEWHHCERLIAVHIGDGNKIWCLQKCHFFTEYFCSVLQRMLTS